MCFGMAEVPFANARTLVGATSNTRTLRVRVLMLEPAVGDLVMPAAVPLARPRVAEPVQDVGGR